MTFLGHNLIFDTRQHTEFSFYSDVVGVGIFHYFFRELGIFFKTMMRGVDHYRRKAGVDTLFGQLKRISMIKM